MEKTIIENISKTEKANSFQGRYSGVGSEFKLYWDSLEELKEGITAVIEAKKFLETKLNETIVAQEVKK